MKYMRLFVDHGIWKWLGIAYPQFNADGNPSLPYQAHLSQGQVPTEGDPGFLEPAWTVLPQHLDSGLVNPEHYAIGDRISVLLNRSCARFV